MKHCHSLCVRLQSPPRGEDKLPAFPLRPGDQVGFQSGKEMAVNDMSSSPHDHTAVST